jgi:GPR1/FUN34/yaaH family
LVSTDPDPFKEDQMSITFDGPARAVKPAAPELPPEAAPPPELATPPAAAATWGNSAPLALAAFAVPTFMLSAINVGWVSAAVTPMIFAVAFMSGGIVQLIAGSSSSAPVNTFTGVLSAYTAHCGCRCSPSLAAGPVPERLPARRMAARPDDVCVQVQAGQDAVQVLLDSEP